MISLPRHNRGFTFIELMVVVVMIIIAFTLAIASISRSRVDSRNSQRISDMKTIQTALEAYRSNEGLYPTNSLFVPGQPLVGPTSGSTYLRAIPSNPKPWNDGICPNTDYAYQPLDNQASYAISYCLSEPKGRIASGPNYAVPSDITSLCLANCSGKCTGASNGCGGTCSNNCNVGFNCESGLCRGILGYFWTEQTGSGIKPYRGGLVCNHDCSRMAAASQEQGIYLSSNSGEAWVQKGTWSWQYSAIAGSSDLKKLAVAVRIGKVFDKGVWIFMNYIHTSDDYGMTWTPRTNSGLRAWNGVASSADGVKLAATVSNGYIYTSSDSGETWVERTVAGLDSWADIASSDNGNTLLAVDYDYIHISYGAGETWEAKTGVGQAHWSAVAMSADGTKMYATTGLINGYSHIYRSTDSGATWTDLNTTGFSPGFNQVLWDISTSADGTRLVATAHNAYMYTSSDSGDTWTRVDSVGSDEWNHAIVSPDGTRIVAARDQDYIYTSP